MNFRSIGLATIILLAPFAVHGDAGPKYPHLGGFEVCEASAAAVIACPDRPRAPCVLVGDNEQRKTLFAYPLAGDGLDVRKRSELDIREPLGGGNRELSDIEALARLTTGEVIVVGSHSRNKSCERRKKRRRFVGLRFENGGAVAGEVPLVRTSESFNLAAAFPDGDSGVLGAARAAVEEAERKARDGDCVGAFNIEGAVALPGASRPDEVWLGLRSPLVEGRAVLLRLAPDLDALRFDDARLVDLDGFGIRDLTYARGWVWGIAGPVPDSATAEFKLWRFRLPALRDGSTIEVDEIAALPTSAEGLVIRGTTAIVVIDGDELGDDDAVTVDGVEIEEACARDAAYVALDVPW